MNIQQPEKQVQALTLSLHSVFETIQGEGPFCGTPCVFIRLAGCNLQCPACDTDYTTGRVNRLPNEIVAAVTGKRRTGLVVITGGEPFRQKQTEELIKQLLDAGYYVQVESNGTLPPPFLGWSMSPEKRSGCYLVVSPKTGKLSARAWKNAVAVKYVVERGKVREEDGLPTQALRHRSHPYVARPPADWTGEIYVQPMDSQDPALNEVNTRQAIASCLKFGYTLQVQIHKVVGVA